MRLVVFVVLVGVAFAISDVRSRFQKAAADPPKAAAAANPAPGPFVTLDGKQVEQSKIDAFKAKLKPYDTSKVTFYHWHEYKQCIRWGAQGYVNKGEMDFLTRPEGDATLALAGAGMYISGDPLTSASFGPCLTIFELPNPLPLYSEADAKAIFGASTVTKRFKVELGKIVPFIDFYNSANKWYVTHHHENVKKCRLDVDATVNRMRGSQIQEFTAAAYSLGDSNEMPKMWKDAIGYYVSLFNLMYYFDPISLVRAVKVSPGDPWSQFEPEHFGAFMKARMSYVTEVIFNKKKFGTVSSGVTIGGTSSRTTDKAAWAVQMLKDVIPSFAKSIADKVVAYRSEQVRGGGDELKDSFLAAGYQVDNMARNNLLLPMFEPTNKIAGDYYTAYWYVHPDHVSKPGQLPFSTLAQTAQKNKATDPQAYPNFFSEVSKLVLADIYGKPATPTTPAQVQYTPGTYNGWYDPSLPYAWRPIYSEGSGIIKAMQRLISVHPFGNFNGRSVRMFGMLTALEAGIVPPLVFNGDMDTLENEAQFARHVDESTKLGDALQREMTRKFLSSALKGEKAEINNVYKDLDWLGWFDSLKPLGLDSSVLKQWDKEKNTAKLNEVWGHIEKRRWTALYDLIVPEKGAWKTNRVKPTQYKPEEELKPDPDRKH